MRSWENLRLEVLSFWNSEMDIGGVNVLGGHSIYDVAFCNTRPAVDNHNNN